MPRIIAINGTRLDEVRMPLPPQGNGTITSLSYPMSQIRFVRDDYEFRLIVPAYLAVELYRSGILPQDATLPVAVSIGGRSTRWYTVSDVRYPDQCHSSFGEVTFTLTRVLQGNVSSAAGAPPLSQSTAAEGTYVTDITHYLDEAGELARMPAPARKLASFLTLLIEAATGTPSAQDHDSGIRCRTKSCRGIIQTSLPANQGEITWYCLACGHNGVIRNWRDTNWNQLKRSAQPE
jgi:hypothetical protein